MQAKYSFEELSPDVFQIKEDGFFLLKFTRSKIRTELEEFAERYDRSSKWIGSIIRLFNERFPSPHRQSFRSDPLDLLHKEDRYTKALRERGYNVYKPSATPEDEMISFLRSRGLVVDGALSASPYMMPGGIFCKN